MHPGTMSANAYANKPGAEIRALCRGGEFDRPTAGVALGYTQVNPVILRAHGLIKKIPRTHRYLLTQQGATVMAALLAVRNATLAQLNAA